MTDIRPTIDTPAASGPVPAPGVNPFARLEAEVVLVTGGAQGIGAAVRDSFAAVGAKVVAADLSFSDEGPARHDGEEFWRAHLDVTDEAGVEALADAVAADPGLGTIGVLVNCAGSSTMARVVDTTADQWEFNLGLNARGSFLTARAVARRLEAAGRPGRIILVASQAGKNGYRGMGAYVASKHAVLGLTKTLAIEEAPYGITVNAVCPGIIETAMKWRERVEGGELRGMSAADVEAEDNSQVPLGRTGQPADVAGVCLFLASDLASYMTGQGINVTGGMTMN
ncbi:SDR family NAD(P)-dependent oxidoreductase [Acidipropionibacterium virtanenii]|uniref:Dihydroanticapsin 7-dehydrogenase n=1 Tax=Acidipropionibacterium virtanenii TaxID=2057246 RepID=A0A344UQL5_9ACTN|nr:SDR family NAD(P)-dependent oxidoreductase [Acidipropionibacterium virtanenii]AXE37563.1 Dihydroanticapsin 7-dehydrogenase [Acidipropionibacterium virtanenii]